MSSSLLSKYLLFKLRRAALVAALTLAALAVLSGCAKQISVSGTEFPSDAKELTLSAISAGDYAALSEFTELEKIDASAAALSPEAYESLARHVGDKVRVIWSVPLHGAKVRSDAKVVSFSDAITDEDVAMIRYFKNIETLSVTGVEMSKELQALSEAAREVNPDVKLNCKVTVYGKEYDSAASDTLFLNEKKIKKLDKVHMAVATFPGIKAVEMCDCGVSNEKMQELRETYPDVKFVWTISFLKKFKVRTDIRVFSTLANEFSRPGNSRNLAPVFKYCTELRALDLGHQAITDISDIRNLKHLHTLILADNSISDISPLAELKELVYIELFFNRIKDVSPLLELPNLLDLNICFNPTIKNPTVLTGCKKLERLYISRCGLSQKQIATLKEGIPENCIFNYTCRNAVFGNGWRGKENVRNAKVREAFRNWRRVEDYPSWDNIIYKKKS